MAVAGLRPGRTTLTALIGLAWAVGSGAIRDFVWADLRAGLLDLRGFSHATRGLVISGFVLLFAMVGALLYNDFWREMFGLVVMTIGTPGRGTQMPMALVPATMFLLAMAWSFALAGALHSHWAIRLGVLLLYLLTGIAWSSTGVIGSFEDRSTVLGVGGLAAVVVVFALRWRASARPAAEFTVMLALVAATLVSAQARTVDSWRLSGIPLGVVTLHANLISMGMLIMPLLLMIGVNIADFARRAAGWVADIGEARLPVWMVYAGLGGLALWRLRDLGQALGDRLAESTPQAQALEHLGALMIPLTVWLVWWVVEGQRRRRRDDAAITADDVGEAASGFAPKLILAYLAVTTLGVVLYNVALAVIVGVGITRVAQGAALIQAVSSFMSQSQTFQNLLELASLLAAYPLARRGRYGLALYLGAFGARGIWVWLTAPGRPLDALLWHGTDVVMTWWTVTFLLFGAFWLARRELTSERAGRLVFLLLITYLLEQTDFISNPFSPFFSFAGIGFIAFGIVWDSITIGSWANRETRGLPRVSRIFLYLGYVLLTVTLINWVLTSHDLKELNRLTGETALHGMHLFGKPMLYGIFVATLMLPARTRAGTATGDTD